MSRAARVSKADIDRTIKALTDAGQSIGRVIMRPSGDVEILTGKPEATLTALERWRVERGRGSA